MNKGQERYVYCIIPRPPLSSFSFLGIGDKPVTLVPYENLAAVVSESPLHHYPVNRDHTLKHEWVIEQVMQCYTVLPVRFGTVAASEEDIRVKLLRRHFGSLHGMLKRLDNKVELDVKAFWDRQRIFPALLGDDPELRLFRDVLAGGSQAETRYGRIQLGQMVEQALTARRSRDNAHILETLRPLAHEVRESAFTDEMMVLNAAFLVDRRRESVFDARMRALDDECGGLVHFRCVGLLPPFSFASLAISWDEADLAAQGLDQDGPALISEAEVFGRGIDREDRANTVPFPLTGSRGGSED